MLHLIRNNWLWAVSSDNWKILKEKNVWASSNKDKIREMIRPKDSVVFYVSKEMTINGIYEFVEDWYDATESIWSDEINEIKYPSQIKIKQIKEGKIKIHDIANRLKIFEDKEFIENGKLTRNQSLILKPGGSGFPANNAHPIPHEDFEILLEKLDKNGSDETHRQVTDEEKEKFKNIEKVVLEGLHDKTKSIEQLEEERGEKYIGDHEQEELRTKSIWHNKIDLDIFVSKKLNLDPKKWGADNSKNTFYKRVANVISKLRNEGEIVDWKYGLPRYGIWRLTNDKEKQAISGFQNGDYSCPSSISSVVRRTKQEKFRKELLKEHNCRCVFCEFNIEKYLRAAHIVPFATMQEEDPSNAVNPTNGLLLCALCDIAFEKGDIIVNEAYQIIKNEELLVLSKTNPTINSWVSNIKNKLEISNVSKFRPDVKFLRKKLEMI